MRIGNRFDPVKYVTSPVEITEGIEAGVFQPKSMLYHLSNTKYDYLKSKAMLLKAQGKEDEIADYDHRISFLLTVVTLDDILKYIKSDFERWNMEEAYLYIVDPRDIKHYDFATMQSTPEQKAYDDANWNTDHVSDRDFPKWRKQYMARRKEVLEQEYDLPATASIETYMNNPRYEDWQKHEWVEYNRKHGNKDQYASYIPHMQIQVNQPVKFQKIVKLR